MCLALCAVGSKKLFYLVHNYDSLHEELYVQAIPYGALVLSGPYNWSSWFRQITNFTNVGSGNRTCAEGLMVIG